MNNELLDIVAKISIDKLRLLDAPLFKEKLQLFISTFKILIDSKVIPADTILKKGF